MSKKSFLLVFFSIFYVFSCNMNEDQRFTKKYILIPSAQYVSSKIDAVFPSCINADFPMKCEDKSSCCPSGYPYACPQIEKCSTTPTDCNGTAYPCVYEPLIITSVSPGGSVDVSYDATTKVDVSFKKYQADDIVKMVINIRSIDGHFEQPVSQQENLDGKASTSIIIRDKKPELSECLQDCSKNGTCGPCFVETNIFSWIFDYILQDSKGNNYGTIVNFTQISLKLSD